MKHLTDDLELLQSQSETVSDVGEIKGIFQELEYVLDKHKNGVGLSAVQIGIPKKVSLIKYGKKRVELINARVIDSSDSFTHTGEGCLSFPGLFVSVPRFEHITIKNNVIREGILEEETLYFYYSKDEKENGNDGILALAVQHEIDHFSGKTILDYKVIKEPAKSNKVGRNEPCPCGSGKKYKKCCLK